MKVMPTRLPEILVIEPKVFVDERGCFFESFNQKAFDEAVGYPVVFVQDNHSVSTMNVLRGLHCQLEPRMQGKLVRVIRGEVFDVAVDIRPGSPTYGHWVGTYLSAENRKQMWVPPGFAHGFMTVSSSAECLYKVTDYYSPEHERSIAWNDPALAIDWPNPGLAVLSAKDRGAPCLTSSRLQ